MCIRDSHYSELKAFALETPGVQNASCEFNVETLRPTYKLSVGVPGKSNAFLISEKLGVDKAVIARAQGHLSEEDRQFDAILAQLDDLKVQLKEKQAEVDSLRETAANAVKEAQEKRDKLIKQGEAELAAARDKARAVTQEVQALSLIHI